jgi:tetratricopeptide (TPR) repeat protein
MDDIFAIQDEISARVVEQLKLTLLDGVPTVTQVDPRAFDLYLQARHIVDTEKRSQIKEAHAMLDKALEIEPQYAAAIVELQRVYYRLMVTGAITRDDFATYARQSVTRLEEINPNSVEALFQRGWTTLMFDNNLQLAANYFEQAMAMDPTHLELLRWIVMLLTELDRTDEAIAVGRYLILNDPSCDACFGALLSAYRQAGRHEEGALAMEESLRWSTGPMSPYLGWGLGVSWLVAGHPDKALEAFEAIEQTPTGRFGKVFALYDLGRTDEFETQFAELKDESSITMPESIARVYAWTENNDKAFEWLDKAAESLGSDIYGIIDSDLYTRIKPDPRWRALREQYKPVDAVAEIEFNITLPPGVSIP